MKPEHKEDAILFAKTTVFTGAVVAVIIALFFAITAPKQTPGVKESLKQTLLEQEERRKKDAEFAKQKRVEQPCMTERECNIRCAADVECAKILAAERAAKQNSVATAEVKR
jgi:hypothetical protein